jgi:hypothetical protein
MLNAGQKTEFQSFPRRRESRGYQERLKWILSCNYSALSELIAKAAVIPE